MRAWWCTTEINARQLAAEEIGEAVDLATCDVSFISVTLILPAVAPLLRPAGKWLYWSNRSLKPARAKWARAASCAGPRFHQAACQRVERAAADLGFRTDVIESPILGAEGNQEFLLYAHH